MNISGAFDMLAPSTLYPSDRTLAGLPALSSADATSQAENWFKSFIANYDYPAGGGIVTSSAFLDQLAKENSLVVKMSDSPDVRYEDLRFVAVDPSIISSLPSYEKVFSTLFPNSTHAEFTAAMTAFIDKMVTTYGYFVPGHFFPQWTTAILHNAQAEQTVFPPSTLAALDSDRLLVLNRIFTLIINILAVLHQVAAAQADRLIILSNWQNAYTNSLGQLHIFLANDSTRLDESLHNDDKQLLADQRSDANDKINGSFRDLMQNLRSVTSDDAKSMQSNINQTNDAVSQQANIATTIIQDLTGLLNSIFR